MNQEATNKRQSASQKPITIGIMLRHMHEKGGIQVYSKNMIRRLLKVDKKNRYVLLTPFPVLNGNKAEFENAEEVIVKSTSLPGKKVIWDQYQVLKFIKKYDLDVVYNPKLSVPVFAPCKTVLSIPGMEQFAARHLFRWYDRMYYQVAMKFYCKKADAILIMTPTGKIDLMYYLNAAEHKIHVIPASYNELCVQIKDAAELQRVKTKYHLPDSYLLFVGGITPLKNIPALLKALKSLKAKGYHQQLVIVGFRRWKFEKDMAMIETLGLQKDVIELGFVDDQDLPAIYNLAECFILPSFYEGFGIPVLEAQACGCPVVISNGGGLLDVAGKDGALIFEPDHPEELADRIEIILTKNNIREKLVQQGFENVKRFNWDVTASKTVEIFEKICSK